MEKIQCADCNWQGSSWDAEYIEDIYDRVSPGDVMPWGQCPDCGSLIAFEKQGD